MAGNEVTLTFAGDASSLERAMNRVGQASEEMANDVGQASRQMASRVGDSEEAFEGLARSSGRLGEALDRASGSMSMLSGGIGDIGGAMTAFTDLQDLAKTKALEHQAALLNVEQAQRDYDEAVKEFGASSLEARQAQLALTAAQQAAEPPSKMEEWGEKLELLSPIIMAAVGATDLLILANMALSASWVKTAATTAAARVATIASSVATGVATAAQWLWNIALTANPIGVIVMAVAALVGVIILIATKTTWFQTIWEYVWGAVLAYINFVKDSYTKAFRAMMAIGEFLIDQIKAIPGRIGAAFSGLFNIITAPFRAAFNFVARAWNNTIGRLSWSVPGWVPGIGGNSISAPKLREFHQGGVVPGAPGTEMVALLQAGERVTPAGASGGATVIEIRSGGARLDDLLVEVLASAVSARGGNVQLVLGGRRG